jgi:hypothetical protein
MERRGTMTNTAKARWRGGRRIANLRLADEERELLEEAAGAAGLPFATWLRLVALERAAAEQDGRRRPRDARRGARETSP